MQFPVLEPCRQLSRNGQGHVRIGECSSGVRRGGGAYIEAGDVIIADDDGVVVVKRAVASEVVAASEQRILKEEATRERLAHGELGLDIYGLRSKITELGIKYL